jgi:Icc protein
VRPSTNTWPACWRRCRCRCTCCPATTTTATRLRRSFADHAYLGQGDFLQYTVALSGGLRLVALDTVEAGDSAGPPVPAASAVAGQHAAQHAGEPIVVAMHHPPFETLIGHMDRIGLLQGADELAEILARHPNVERVICGHLHRSIVTRFGGTVASTAPSPAHQVSLDLAPDAASTWTLEPPGFHLHAWTEPGRLLTHFAAIGTFDGPHPFHDGGGLID